MKNKFIRIFCGLITTITLSEVLVPMTVCAEAYTGWKEEDGKWYWYESDVRQGYDANNVEYRGKEIYDPGTNAWYWLDNVQGGAKAVSKDVYQESQADATGTIGKWVRYDANGLMVKGWDDTESGAYYFDLIYGTMLKGNHSIDGVDYHFNEETGIMDFCSVGFDNKWVTINGVEYWYEGGVRQGYDAGNPNYRGKEIFDPGSNAWYWLDNVDAGKKAVSKDVYQDSRAGEWGDYVGDDGECYGKWVRYDANGHMIKGWSTNENGTYYFDPVYGTMAKGNAIIDGVAYYFDENTGICQGEAEVNENLGWHMKESYYLYADGTFGNRVVREYDGEGKWMKEITYTGDKVKRDGMFSYTYYSEKKEDMILDMEEYYEYDEEGNNGYYHGKEYGTIGNTPYLAIEYIYTYKNGKPSSSVIYGYMPHDDLTSKNEITFDENGKELKEIYYMVSDGVFDEYYTCTYEYDENGYLSKKIQEYIDDKNNDKTVEYVNDETGNVLLKTEYVNGEKTYTITYTYDQEGNEIVSEKKDVSTGCVSEREEYVYNENGDVLENRGFSAKEEWGYELRLTSKSIYEYNENGKNTLMDNYTYRYDEEGKQTEEPTFHTVTTYYNLNGKDYTRAYNRYIYGGTAYYEENGNMVLSEDGQGEWGYTMGYEYVRDEKGNVLEYYSYEDDKDDCRKIDYHTVYHDWSYDKTYIPGQIQEIVDYTRYNDKGEKLYDKVYLYETYEKVQ